MIKKIILLPSMLLLALLVFGQTAPKFTLKDFYKKNPQLDSVVNLTFNQINDTLRIGQMLIQATGGIGKSKAEIIKLIKSGYIGGVLYLKTTKQNVDSLNKIFAWAAKANKKLPLVFATDAEPSLINNKIKGLKQFKKTNQIKDTTESFCIGQEIAGELKSLNIKYNFAPVSDLSFNTAVINNRSFGSDKLFVYQMCKAFISGLQGEGIAATAKHFPGHGNVKGDSHLNLVCIDGELTELDTYKPLIEDSLISIMIGHIAVKNNKNYSTEGLPSTCSKKIVTDLLRKEMGFKGIIITDGMNMGALNAIPDATLKAVEAGCDIILIPGNEKRLVKQILRKIAVTDDFKSQVYDSVKRIIRMKVCLGIITYEFKN